MIRRTLALFMILALLCPAWAQAGAPESHLYHFTRLDEAPGAIADALAKALGEGFTVLDGYATLREIRWRYGQAVVRDAEGYALCALDYLADAWQITVSHAALRQDQPPQLLPEAAEYGYTDEEVDQMDGCGSFKIVYSDATYRWFAGSDGWNMIAISVGTASISVYRDSVSRWDEAAETNEFLYNTLPVDLEHFSIAAFPTDWEAFKALSESSEYADDTKGLTDAPSDLPDIALLSDPASGDCSFYLYGNVAVTVSEEKDGFVHVTAGPLDGWIARDQLLIGTERARGDSWRNGVTAEVYGWGAKEAQPVYARRDRQSDALALLPPGARISVLAVSARDDYQWFFVETPDGILGFMACDTVCAADNMRDAWIYSDDPSRRLNLREAPDRGAKSLGKYYSGVCVSQQPPLTVKDGWIKVLIEGAAGYVDADYLDFSDDYSGREWLPPLGIVQDVNSKGLNLRRSPSADSAIIAVCPKGEKVEILGIVDGVWAHVRLRDGSSGYMMHRYLGGEPAKAVGNSFRPAVSGAKRYAVHAGADGEWVYAENGAYPQGVSVRVAERPAQDRDQYLFARDAKDSDHTLWIKADEFDFWQ